MFRLWVRDEALAAPATPSEDHLQSIIILVVAAISLVDISHLRSFRHRLITGLAISDALMALNFLCSTAMNVFVIQTDYWVLTIAVCTYFILAGHKTQSIWVQTHELVIWTLPWFFSVLWASIGLGVVGYGDIGAWCWFTSDTVRLLVNFIPRWAIIVFMFALYAHLSFALHKAYIRRYSIHGASLRHLEYGTTTEEGSRMTSIHGPTEGRSTGSIRRLKRVARLMLLYPLAYAIIWSLPTAIRIYQATKNKRAPFALQTADKVAVVIQGFVDAVIYGVNETALASWRARFLRQVYPVLPGTESHREHGLATDVHRGPFYQSHIESGLDATILTLTEPTESERNDASSSNELRDFRA
ncbi:hypothetical protein LZ30DRAFT_796533 [Colletotrichum cereale]|nr:hypothetical protein LZ30DRAFT_796533 [Colletotrichum cereale]